MDNRSFICGVFNTYPIENNTRDLAVAVRVKGIVCVGDTVYATNIGDDNNVVSNAEVVQIEVEKTNVNSAKDCIALMIIKDGNHTNIKKGTVLCMKETPLGEVTEAYVTALGDAFILNQRAILSEDDYAKAGIADLAEVMHLYTKYVLAKKKANDEEAIKDADKKIGVIRANLLNHIQQADEIFCAVDNSTGAPHMYVKLCRDGDKTMCSKPVIMLVPKAYVNLKRSEKALEADNVTLKKLSAKDGELLDFLGEAFYLNGAAGAFVWYDEADFAAERIVSTAKDSNDESEEKNLYHPEIARWLLLIGQLSHYSGEDKNVVLNAFFGFLGQALKDVELWMPVKDENTFSVTMWEGNDSRKTVDLYTDIPRLRSMYDDKWKPSLVKLDSIIQQYECNINATKFSGEGFHLSVEMYNKLVKKD